MVHIMIAFLVATRRSEYIEPFQYFYIVKYVLYPLKAHIADHSRINAINSRIKLTYCV